MNLLIAIITSFLVTLTLTPIIIKLFKSINLLDTPGKRKIHNVSTPSLGGIAIFSGILIAIFFSTSITEMAHEKYFLAGTILIFLLGIRDDLSSLLAHHKLVIQAFSAFLIIYLSGVKIEGFSGLFGVSSFPWYFNEIFSVFILVVMTNAFNLIDGIDGLAGSIALIISSFLGWAAFQTGNHIDAIFAFAISGASLAFLLYNWYPSKVFMGDTGSMVLGFMLTILMIKFLTTSTPPSVILFPTTTSLGLFILPIYDTLRVFTMRFYSGRPPLLPDRNHIHHVLLKLGLNHAQSTICLISYNIIIILFTLIVQSTGELWVMLIIMITTIGIGAILDRKLIKRETAILSKLIPPKTEYKKSHTSV